MKNGYAKIQTVILITILCISVLFKEIAAYAVGGVFKENFLSLYTDATANVFSGDDVPRVRVKIKNPYESALTVTLASRAVGRDSEVVWSGSKGVTLEPKETKITNISIEDVKIPFGTYELQVEVSGNFSNTFFKSIKFAVCVENREVNDWATANFHLGDNPNYENLEKNLELAKKAGFAGNRDDVRWYRTEREIGNPQLPEWRKNIIDSALENGGNSSVYILGIEHYTYTGGLCPHEYDKAVCANHVNCRGNSYTFAEQVAAYARFCGYMAEELKGTKPIFELGNEPELDRAYPDTARYFNFTGQAYAELVKAAYQAIKAVDAEATVISAGTCALANDNSKGFLTEFLSVDGITNYIDGLGFHPYSYIDDYTDEISVKNAAFYAQVDFAMSQLEAAMKRDGTSGIKLWATEFGSKIAENDWKQAAIDVRTMITAGAEPTVRMMNIYNFVCKGTDTSYGENRFGIIEKNYTSVKPAYAALSHMNLRLAGAEYREGLFERVYSGRRTFSAYGFQRETEMTKQYTYVFWGQKGKSAALTVNWSGEEGTAPCLTEEERQPSITVAKNAAVKVYDMVGNELSQSSIYSLSGEPLYVVATVQSKDKVKIEKSGNRVSVTGIAKAPGEAVTLLATKENSLTPSYAAFDQTVSDNLSEYKFSFSLPQDAEQYSVYVFDGNEKSLTERNAAFTNIKLQYFVNGSPVESLDAVCDNDLIQVRLTLNDTDAERDKLKFFGVIYGKTGVVLAIDAKSVVWNTASGTADITLKPGETERFGKMKFFLWDDIQTPITAPLEVQRKETNEK